MLKYMSWEQLCLGETNYVYKSGGNKYVFWGTKLKLCSGVTICVLGKQHAFRGNNMFFGETQLCPGETQMCFGETKCVLVKQNYYVGNKYV